MNEFYASKKHTHSRSRLTRDSFVLLGMCGLVFASIAGAASVTYTYDEIGRLKTVAYSNGAVADYHMDAAGNRTSVVTTLDTTAPGPPANFTATAVSATQVNLSWNANDSTGSTIAGYNLYRAIAGQALSLIATLTNPSFQDTGLAAYTTYQYAVSEFDNATPPNVSAQTTTIGAKTFDVTPSQPTGLAATAVSPTQINLSWKAASDPGGSGVTGYSIYRAQSGQAATLITTVTSPVYQDLSLATDTAYTYTVAAYNIAGQVSTQSLSASATTLDAPPGPPTGLAATAVSATQVNLTWTAPVYGGGAGLSGYKLYRNQTYITSVATASYSDTAVGGAQTYNYTIVSEDRDGTVSSPPTAFPPVTTPAGLPGAPSISQSAVLLTPGSTVTISWTSVTNATSYQLYTTLNGGTFNLVYSGTALSEAFSNLIKGEHDYKVQACDTAGCGNFSSTAVVMVCPKGGCTE